MDDNNDCITKLVEYNHSFFLFDPNKKSSPYNLDDDDDYDWDTKISSTASIASKKELIKALALSRNVVEVELDNDNNIANILDTGEGTDNSDNEQETSSATSGSNNMGDTRTGGANNMGGSTNTIDDTRTGIVVIVVIIFIITRRTT